MKDQIASALAAVEAAQATFKAAQDRLAAARAHYDDLISQTHGAGSEGLTSIVQAYQAADRARREAVAQVKAKAGPDIHAPAPIDAVKAKAPRTPRVPKA